MSDNENTRPEAENKTNEQQTNEQSATRFVLTTEDEVDQFVSNAQSEATKAKTIYAVNIFRGRFVLVC